MFTLNVFLKKLLLLSLLVLVFCNSEAQETITTIYGDGHAVGSSNNFYTSSTVSRKTYNDSNNLLGFVSAGSTFSTGVNDAALTSHSISFTAAKFTAFPVPADININSTSLIGIGYNWEGTNQTNASTDYINATFSPIVPSFFMKDGSNGLELSSNFFNIPAQDIEYNAVVINPAVSINDAIPDIIVTQTGSPGGVSDKFRFIDSDGNIVGNEVDVDFTAVSTVGGTDWTIYNVNKSGTVSGLFGSNTYRTLKMISFKLSDFGINSSNYSEIEKLRHTISGNTDIAFTAYNNGGIGINLPDAELEVSNSSITADDYCTPTTAIFKTTVTNNSTNDAIDLTVKFNTPTGITFSSNSSVFSAGSGSASYNVANKEWNISGLGAGENVQLTLNSTASGTTFPLTFTPTASLDYQSDSNTNNDSQVISNLGNDNDCDGVEDASDLDDDNDGILDSVEGTGDDDNDGIANYLDLDSDGDQCPDALEGAGTVAITDLDENYVITGSVNGNGVPTLAAAGGGSGQGIGNSQNDGVKTCDTTDTDSDGYIDIVDLDDDNDGILDSVEGASNSLDTDSDNDGCPDALEGGASFELSSLDVNDRLTGGVDENGIPTVATANGQTIGDSQDAGTQSSSCALLPVIISQVYQTASGGKAIELTNIGASSVSNVRLSLFKDIGSGDPTGVSPTASATIASLASGKSVVIKSVATLSGVTLINSPDEVLNASVTDFDGSDDIIVLSTTTDTSTWANRYDVVEEIDDESSLVRIDEIITSNSTYTASEWMSFVDDNIAIVGDADPIPAITRHVNAPLLSEVKTPISSDVNNGLGYHVLNSTIRLSNAWTNGTPDKSRSVIIQEDYEHTGSALNARILDVQDTNTLTISNNALVVINGTNINSGAEIRVLGAGQFIQTHDGATQVTGSGTLSISQKSELPNTYRFNYWSSPVVEATGGTLYRVGEVLKDAGGDLTKSSSLSDINFIYDLDGSTGTPINISNRWIYGYFDEENSDDWILFTESSYINHGLGFTMKSTGVNPQYFTFSGIPNDGDFSLNISGDTSSLLGNPYPGTLDGKAFILNNENAIDGALYFWEHTGESSVSGHLAAGYQGGYAMLTLSMATAATTPISGTNGLGSASKIPSRYIAAGQGFFVVSDADGGTINFNNKQRSYDAGASAPVFFKTSQNLENDLPILKLGLIFDHDDNTTLHRQIGISFSENHSYAFDYGYEAEMIDANPTDVYWTFKQMDDKKLVIAGVEQVSEELAVPLTISVDTDVPVSLKIDEQKNINKDVYLYDALEGTFSVLEKNEVLTLPLSKGIYNGRFYITFNNNIELSNAVEKEFSEFDLQVYMNNEENEIVIEKGNELLISNIEVYNVFGQKIEVLLHEEIINKTTINVKELSSAVYFVSVETNKGTLSKKILKH